MKETPGVQLKKDLLETADFIIQNFHPFYKNLKREKQR